MAHLALVMPTSPFISRKLNFSGHPHPHHLCRTLRSSKATRGGAEGTHPDPAELTLRSEVNHPVSLCLSFLVLLSLFPIFLPASVAGMREGTLTVRCRPRTFALFV